MSTNTTRPVIPNEITDEVNKLIDLPVQIGFDKALKILLVNYEKYQKFYKKHQGDPQK